MTSKPTMRFSFALLLFIMGHALHGYSFFKDDRPCITRGETIHLQKRVLSTAQLCKDKSQSPKRVLPPCPPPPPVATFSVPTQNPSALPGAFFPASVNSLTPPPQTVGVTFTAADLGIQAIFIGSPPGPMGTVGPQQYFVAGDERIATFDKTTGELDGFMDIDIQSFTNTDGDMLLVMDFDWGKARYDKHSDRFYFIKQIYDSNGDLANNGFTIAVSDSGVITNSTQWTVVDFFNQSIIPDSTGCPGDQGLIFDLAHIGIDKHALYIGQLDMAYNFSDPNCAGCYATNSAFVVQKESLFSDGPVVINVFRNVPGFPGDQSPIRFGPGALTGVDNFDEDPEFGYFIGIDPEFFGRLNLYRVINPGSKTPSLSAAVPLNVLATGSSLSTSIPFSTNLFGTIGALGSWDDSLTMAHIRNNQLFTVHQILVNANGVGDQAGDRSALRWYQIDVTGGGTETATSAITLVQAGTLWDPTASNPLFYTFPSIMTNARGDMVIAGNISSAAASAVPLPMSGFFVGRLSGDALGSLRIGATRTGTIFALGSGTYTRVFAAAVNGGQPWGPFSNASLDPADDMTIWTIQEIVRNGLETQVVAQLLAP